MNDYVDVLEDWHPAPVARERVEAQTQAWLSAVDALFAQISAWARGHGWHVDPDGSTMLDEEMMQAAAVEATAQPVLRIEKDGLFALFKPKSPWVIGARGRIDLYTSANVFLLLDLGPQDGDAEWHLLHPTKQDRGVPFTPELIGTLV
ncbi:hypothetical protein BJF93_13145 [Xaviernesmea oryzae]|uniref:Uncharacterized protein n=1 Tax=Xaviernesmea oryzae TaxID=464029 RepID=A0A1Q9AQT4_9HYPH|nr:hypothetical protein [Xaviernesmea oryzae]OLP57797.1 hypothetical protein BJF93_13145 [Xaviernesmea oryzae]SEL36655.1 hypothetical protein SAMN04487976_107239 [Xaviernesmea oryzae]